MTIRLIQILCPRRHALMSMPYVPEEMPHEQAMKFFCQQFDEMCPPGVNRRCGMCGSEDLVFEDQLTSYQSWAEAMPEFAKLAKQQALAWKLLNANRN